MITFFCPRESSCLLEFLYVPTNRLMGLGFFLAMLGAILVYVVASIYAARRRQFAVRNYAVIIVASLLFIIGRQAIGAIVATQAICNVPELDRRGNGTINACHGGMLDGFCGALSWALVLGALALMYCLYRDLNYIQKRGKTISRQHRAHHS